MLLLFCFFPHPLHAHWWWLFPHLRGFFENVQPFIPRLCFFKWRLAEWLSELIRPVAECSLTSCVWARFRIGSHTMPGQWYSQPSWLCWVKGVCTFTCNLYLAEWLGSFMYHCSNMGVEQTPNKSQHTKLTLEKKFLPPLLPGFKLTTFQSRVQRSYQEAISAHITVTLLSKVKIA